MKKRMKTLIKMLVVMVLCGYIFTGCSLFGIGEEEQSGPVEIDSVPISYAVDKYSVQPKEQAALVVSFKDEGNYYYLFDIGAINNVPLEKVGPNLKEYVNHGQEVTITFEKQVATEEGVTETVGVTTEKSTSLTSTKSCKVGFEIGKKDLFKVYAEGAYSRTTGKSETTAWSETYAETSKYSEQNTETIQISFSPSSENGFYGYTLTGNLQIYVFAVYDVQKDTYSVEYYSDITNYWYSFDYFENSDEFNNLSFDAIDFVLPSDLPVPTQNLEDVLPSEVEYPKIVSQMERYNCNDGNQYNKAEEESSEDWKKRHNGFEVGELNLYGCINKQENVFTIKNMEQFSIKYHVLENTENLPRVGTQSTRLNEDTETRAMGTNISSKIGFGAYWLRVTYTDDVQEQYNRTNILKAATKDTYVELINSDMIKNGKEIAKIEVVVLYEIYSGGPGFLGIWWNEYTNWRCEYTYIFEK